MNDHVTIDGMRGTIQGNGMVSFQADDRVNVLFYRKSVLDPVKSRELGRPHHVSLDYVRIQQPGEKDYADRPVSDDPSVTSRWPRHWAHYQSNQKQIPNGAPVDLLFPQHPEIAANLHSMAVHTIEQLAHLTAEGLNQIGMGATQWQNQARAFLAASKQGVGHHQMQKALEDRDNKIDVLSSQIATLKNQLDRLLAEQQGVPKAMIPVARPTQGQAFNASLPDVDLEPLDGFEEQTFVPLAGGPMFDDAAANAEFETSDPIDLVDASESIPQSKPRGRPRKTPE